MRENEPVRSKNASGMVALSFAVSTVAWVAWLGVAPLLPPPLAGITYLLGSFICHQRPERSFHLGVAQLPVCARCLGIYAGAALGSLVWVVAQHRAATADRRGRVSLRLLALAVAPTALTLGAEWAGIWQPSNLARAIAGIPLGLVAALVVIGALTTLHYDACAPRRPIASPPPRAPM